MWCHFLLGLAEDSWHHSSSTSFSSGDIAQPETDLLGKCDLSIVKQIIRLWSDLYWSISANSLNIQHNVQFEFTQLNITLIIMVDLKYVLWCVCLAQIDTVYVLAQILGC